MGKTLTKEEVQSLARLARLRLTDKEIVTYQTELSAILDYVEQLSGAETTGLKPTSQVTGLENVMRSDEVLPQVASPAALLAEVPSSQDGYIKVNRMI